MQFRLQHVTPLAAVLLVIACGGSPSDETPPVLPETGSVSLALRSAVGARTFELRDAVFTLSGTTELELQATDPEAPFLEQSLPVGEYGVALEPGWSLFELGDAEPVAVQATLVSENPQSFEILDGVRTELSFRFELDEEEGTVSLGSGTLSLAIEVAQPQSGAVIFTELMPNPAELADSAGEWLELRNVSNDDVNLQGCSIERDTATAFTIGESLALGPADTATLSVSAAPGFEPDYTYSGLNLPNSGTYTLGLRCGGAILDTVTVDTSTWPGGSGVAASLDPEASSATGNDDASSWCDAAAAYNSDLGSPGMANPDCD